MDLEFYLIAVVFFTLPRQILRRRRNRRNRDAMARKVRDMFES